MKQHLILIQASTVQGAEYVSQLEDACLACDTLGSVSSTPQIRCGTAGGSEVLH